MGIEINRTPRIHTMQRFIEDHTILDPEGTIPVRRLRSLFMATLSPEEKARWPRSRFLIELGGHGMTLATDVSGCSVLIGRSLRTKKPLVIDADGICRRAAK
jgi:hypothetical protein